MKRIFEKLINNKEDIIKILDISKDRKESLDKICEFLDIESISLSSLKRFIHRCNYNWNENHKIIKIKEIKFCEFCGKEHDGSYGSGRFCCQSCSKRYSSIINKDIKNKKISKSLIKPPKIKICPICGKEYIGRRKACSNECSNKLKSLSFHNNKLVNHNMSERAKLSYKNGREVKGGYTKWYSYNDIKVQGTFELRVCRILDKWIELGKISKWEYTNDRIPYKWKDGTEHSYLLDFKVYNIDGSYYYIEVKGYIMDHDEENGKLLEI